MYWACDEVGDGDEIAGVGVDVCLVEGSVGVLDPDNVGEGDGAVFLDKVGCCSSFWASNWFPTVGRVLVHLSEGVQGRWRLKRGRGGGRGVGMIRGERK